MADVSSSPRPAFTAYDSFLQEDRSADSERDLGHIDMALEKALRENPQHPPPPQTSHPARAEQSVAWPFVIFARGFATILMLVLWFAVVGPIWFAVLLRTIAAFSIATTIALFTSATPPEPKRLDMVAELWIRGFRKITSHFSNVEVTPGAYVPIQPVEALRETLFAVLFYSGLYVSSWTIVLLVQTVAHGLFSYLYSAL